MPQITGDAWPVVPVTWNESWHTPPLSSAVLVGPCVNIPVQCRKSNPKEASQNGAAADRTIWNI